MSTLQLQQTLGSRYLEKYSEQYEKRRQIWNSAIDFEPAAIIICSNEQDVVSAIKIARANNWSISVKAGGHHLAGFAVGQDSLVVDLSMMKGIFVKTAFKTVEVCPGVRSGELTAETQKYGLAVPLGTASDTGVFGVALNGGIGYLRGVHGLTCDNIVGATIVTAEGDIVDITEATHPDLLWAIRGGGSYFGVVTKLVFQAYEVGPEVYALDVVYDFDDAKTVFQKAQQYIKTANNKSVAINFAVAVLPPDPNLPSFLHFKKVIMALGMYAGPVSDGERALQQLRELAPPIIDQTGVIPYVQLQQKLDATVPKRVNCYGTSLFLGELAEEAWDVFIEKVNSAPTSSILLQVWTLGGRMNEITLSESSFAIRDAKWALLVDALAMKGEDEACKTWISDVYESLLPYSYQKASYLNAFDPIEDATLHAFDQNLSKLQQLKHMYDPSNIFSNNHKI